MDIMTAPTAEDPLLILAIYARRAAN